MAWIAVPNAYGVWFEIGRVHGWFMAIQLARQSLHLSNWPANEINMKLLTETGKPILMSKAHLQQPETYVDKPPTNTELLSSLTQWGRGGQHPQGTRDDPTGINDLDQDEPFKGKSKELKGVTPTKFNENWSKTLFFLSEFKRFIRMNHDADCQRSIQKVQLLPIPDGRTGYKRMGHDAGWLARRCDWGQI